MKQSNRVSLMRDRRGFTRLEFGLLAAMLIAMVVNGVATLGGGLGGSGRPMGLSQPSDVSNAVASIKR
jgi:Flp pilus assembly pilin Flp